MTTDYSYRGEKNPPAIAVTLIYRPRQREAHMAELKEEDGGIVAMSLEEYDVTHFHPNKEGKFAKFKGHERRYIAEATDNLAKENEAMWSILSQKPTSSSWILVTCNKEASRGMKYCEVTKDWRDVGKDERHALVVVDLDLGLSADEAATQDIANHAEELKKSTKAPVVFIGELSNRVLASMPEAEKGQGDVRFAVTNCEDGELTKMVRAIFSEKKPFPFTAEALYFDLSLIHI